MKYCTHCGQSNDVSSKFCINCGNALSNGVPTNKTSKKSKKLLIIIISLIVAMVSVISVIVIVSVVQANEEKEREENAREILQYYLMKDWNQKVTVSPGNYLYYFYDFGSETVVKSSWYYISGAKKSFSDRTYYYKVISSDQIMCDSNKSFSSPTYYKITFNSNHTIMYRQRIVDEGLEEAEIETFTVKQ